LIFAKIIKIVAARCQILTLTAPNSISVWALPQNPLGECSSNPIAGFKGPTSKERERMRRKGGRSDKGEGEMRDIVHF